jgi:hypothetical protein
MYRKSIAILAAIATLGVGTGAVSTAAAEPAGHLIPQSLAMEHRETIERLEALGRRPGAVGAAARKSLALFRRHVAREEEFILPPLTLLPRLAGGKAAPDMAWAIPMCDRVKAEQREIFQEHTDITTAANELWAAGMAAHDKQAMDFARGAVADSLNDLEIEEPAVLMIGTWLHDKLGTGG